MTGMVYCNNIKPVARLTGLLTPLLIAGAPPVLMSRYSLSAITIVLYFTFE